MKLLFLDIDVRIVLSSTWRLYDDTKEQLAAAGLSWIGQTSDLRAIRGHEIAQFLGETPDVEAYAILDDFADMLPEQLPFLVQTVLCTGCGDAILPS